MLKNNKKTPLDQNIKWLCVNLLHSLSNSTIAQNIIFGGDQRL